MDGDRSGDCGSWIGRVSSCVIMCVIGDFFFVCGRFRWSRRVSVD